MDLLHEIAVRAKWEGTCTLEWPSLRGSVSSDGCLEDVPGKNLIQKLKAWAEQQGLLMDFDVQFSGCTSHIHTVTFWNNPQTNGRAYARPSGLR